MKRVVITGASSGFGYHFALRFARGGYHVIATTRDLKHSGVKQLSDIAEKENLTIDWVVLDVSHQEMVNDVRDYAEKLGGATVLVNNAGYGVVGPVETYTVEDMKAQYETNVFGLARMTWAFLPQLQKQEKATIINISSIAGIIAAPAYALYSSSKWAVEAFSEVLRYELSRTPIRVALVEPGGFDTDFGVNAVGLGKPVVKTVSWFEQSKAKRDRLINSRFRKMRDPRKVADLVYRIAEAKNPKLRNIIGYDAILLHFFRRILPARMWEWAAKKVVKGL